MQPLDETEEHDGLYYWSQSPYGAKWFATYSFRLEGVRAAVEVAIPLRG